MSSRKHERRIARESALALLYSGDMTASDLRCIIEEGAYPADGFELSDYAEQLVLGVAEHQSDIDERLASTSENWAVERMPVVDRALLRLAVFEMLYVDEVPVSVAINEAVELAKAYGGEDDSSRFVNGVLGCIARTIEEAQGDGDAVGTDGHPAAEDAAETDEHPAAEDAAGTDDRPPEEESHGN